MLQEVELRLPEDDAQRARVLPEFPQHVPVMNLQAVPFEAHQRRPVQTLGTIAGRLNGDRVCSSAIFRKSRNVNCSVIAIAQIHGDPSYLGPILQTALDGLRPPIGGELR